MPPSARPLLGKDIRDIGPEIPRRCRTCGDKAFAPSRDCGRCLEDLKVVRDVSALLRQNRQPPLQAGPAPGNGYRKQRAKARRAQNRIDQRRHKNGMPPLPVTRRVGNGAADRPKKVTPKVKTCPVCFTQKARSGACLCS